MDQSALLASLVERGFTFLLVLLVARLLAAALLAVVARATTDPIRRARAAGLAARIGPRCTRGLVAAMVGAGAVSSVATPVLAAPPPRPVLTRAAVPDLDRLVIVAPPVVTQAARPRTHPSHERVTSSPIPNRTVHVVRAGESLWSIAADALGRSATASATATSWPQWYAANRTTVGSDPSVLHPGQRLRPPAVDGAGR